MRITNIGTDLIEVNEENYASDVFQSIKRVHLIKLNFERPTYELIENVLYLFPRTNRFIIDKNIKTYNSLLKRTAKKYYVMNKKNVEIISFFRKNNKILFNFMNLTKEERDFFLMKGVFEDLLRNVEVIALNKKIHDEKIEELDLYKGNVVLIENNQLS